MITTMAAERHREGGMPITESRAGPNAIRWVRDDGYAGTARITN